MKIGVLAMQGAFIEHERALQRIGVETVQVRKKEQLQEIDGLIIPGGESTTIGKLLKFFDLDDLITQRVKEGMPIFGTCAGLILLAKDIADSNQDRLGFMDIAVQRNAFGRQVDSFEVPLNIEGIEGDPVLSVFIRAPYVTEVHGDVQVLAEHAGKIVMVRQGNCLGCAFHPELTEDDRIHRYFVGMIEENRKQ